jgi:signal transduction histidine kinase/streptogramin lyase
VLWFFTASGISTLDVSTKQFLHFNNNPGDVNSLVNDQVLAIHEDRNGFLWIGTFQGLDRLDRRINHYRHFKTDENNPDSLSGNFITAILEDSKGNIWIGTDNAGVNLYDPINETFEHFKHSPVTTNALSNDMVSAMLEDRDGMIWVGTARGMLDRFDPSTEKYTHIQLDAGDEVDQLKMTIRSMIEANDGNLYFGTSFGLFRLNPDTMEITRFIHLAQKKNSLSDDFILSVFQDHNDNLWVGTYGGGLNKFDPLTETFKTYLQKDGLANDTVYGILEDEQGYLWLSTNHGLSRFSPEEEKFVNFDVRDGLQSNEFNERAYFKSASGELFLGGVNGVTAFYPQQVSDNPYPPPIILTSLQVGGQTVYSEETVEAQQSILLKWPENYFEFSFAALNYQQPEDNQYAYFLENFDKTWNINGNLRFGRYTNLPGGTYTLHMVAANEDGIWNLDGANLEVIVVPPFWERPIFLWGMVIVLVFGAGGGYLLKLRSVEIRNQGLERLVVERTEEIEQRRQVAEGLKDVLYLLNSNKSLEESLNFIVCSANRLTQADHVLLMGIKEDPVTYVTVSETQIKEPEGECVDGFQDSKEVINWLAGLATKGKLMMVADLPAFMRNNAIAQIENLTVYRSMLVLPILSGTELMGSLFMLYLKYQQFDNEELELAQSFSDQAALAIGNAQLRDRVQQTAIIAERNRLARDLHDAVTQTLFSASLISEALPSLYEKDPSEGKGLLLELKQLSRGALAEMRTLLLELRPSALGESKLNDLLRQLAEAAEGRTGIKVNLNVQLIRPLPEDVHISLYRIAQEALNNVVKHAQADKVDLVLESEIDEDDIQCVILMISDNGKGFDPQTVRKDHFGLGIIHERAKLIGAHLTLETKKGYGTLIRVEWNGRENGEGES